MNTKFPIQVWRGSVCVRIYQQPSAGVFTVTHYEAGRRIRASFRALAAARREAEQVANRLARHEGESLILRGHDLHEYVRARASLDPIRVGLDSAAQEYRRAVELLNRRCWAEGAAGGGCVASALSSRCHCSCEALSPGQARRLKVGRMPKLTHQALNCESQAGPGPAHGRP